MASCSRSPLVSILDHGAHAGGQHHHAHDALGVDAAVARLMNIAGKTAGQLGELGRRAGVQAQLIADGRGGLDHAIASGWFWGAVMATCITPWVPPTTAREYQRVQRLVRGSSRCAATWAG
jgi:hypothetical protein